MDLGELGDDFNEAPTGRHAYTELHFYTTWLHSAYTSIQASRLSSFLPCSSSPPRSQFPVPARPPVGMHTLNCIFISLDYILHIQVFRLQDCPPSCSVAPPLPRPPPPPPSLPPPPYNGSRGRYRGRRAGRGRRRGIRSGTIVSLIIYKTL